MRSFFFLMLITLLTWLPGCAGSGEKAGEGRQSGFPEAFSTEDLEQRTFRYFWELADPVSGLVPDRYPAKSFSSIAATGFGLAAYITGVEEKYITRRQAAERVLKTLRFLFNLPQGPAKEGVGGYKGLFYHFLDMRTGLRYRDVELSTIDTGLLMAGILACMTYFSADDPAENEIRDLAGKLYARVEWDWAMDGKDVMSMGWHPESGFISSYWYGYNEAMVLLVMAIGSPTHPVPPSAWKVWTSRYNWASFYGYEHVNFGPLFGHQYSHMFIDFRGIKDAYMAGKGIDYFENSRRATQAQRAYAIANPQHFKGYGEDTWGLTACDGPGYSKQMIGSREVIFDGYSARGVAADYHVDDGTIAPTAAGGSIPFAPEICLSALKGMYEKYGKSIYREYGFIDAFNPSYPGGGEDPAGWVDNDYLGIDQGPIVVMLGNHRSGITWNVMKKNPYIVDGLKKAGFRGGWLEGR